MVRSLLIRGMLVGFVAGLLVFGFAKIFGEPLVDRAIVFEAAIDEAKTKAHASMGMPVEAPEPELVSRQIQSTFGLFVGVTVYCTAFGGLFALVFAFASGRAGNIKPRELSALLAAAGFVAIYLVPSLKYPASPPSVGDPDTIGHRTALYFVMMAISIAAMGGAIALRQRLTQHVDRWSAALISAATYALIVAMTQFILPSTNEVPEHFPAETLWQFRVTNLGMQFIMWIAIGLIFGLVSERALRGKRYIAVTDFGEKLGLR